MANYNKLIMVGNLTRDPQLQYLPSNTPLVEFGLAVNRKYKDKDQTCFIDCKLFGKSAEAFNQYMSKGKPVLCEGRLDYEQWQSKEGQKRSKHVFCVERFQFIGSKDAPTESGQQAPEQPAVWQRAEPDEEIPF